MSYFWRLRELSSRDAPERGPISSGSSRTSQNAPRERSGTLKDHPRTLPGPLGPPCAFQSGHLRNENLRLSRFTHISILFDQFTIELGPLQISPCQLLHIFPVYFDDSINRMHLHGPSRASPRTSKRPQVLPNDRSSGTIFTVVLSIVPLRCDF